MNDLCAYQYMEDIEQSCAKQGDSNDRSGDISFDAEIDEGKDRCEKCNSDGERNKDGMKVLPEENISQLGFVLHLYETSDAIGTQCAADGSEIHSDQHEH